MKISLNHFQHGRLKIRTTEEQKALKEKEQKKKLVTYQLGMQKIFSSRNESSFDPECLSICTQLLVVNPDVYTLWNYRKEVILRQIENRYVSIFLVLSKSK